MPIRQLMYAGRLYDKYIQENELKIYGEKQIPLPVPKLVTFYNGRGDRADESVLHLSDAFTGNARAVEADIDVRVRMVNINYGRNKKLLANRAEVKNMCLTEYDEEKVMQMFKEEYLEEGRQNAVLELVKDGDITSGLAAEKLGKSVDEIERLLKELAKEEAEKRHQEESSDFHE